MLQLDSFRGPSKFLALTCALALTGSAFAAPLARAQTGCEENIIWLACGDAIGIPSTDATMDYGYGAWPVNSSCQSGGCYDLKNGRYVTRVTGNPWSDGCFVHVRTQDRYTITGLPPGVPYHFYAEMYVQGSFIAPGSMKVEMQADWPNGEKVSQTFGSPQSSVDAVVRLPLVYEAGQPFRLLVNVFAFGAYPGGAVNTFSELWFSGLPGGAQVTSCQNYDVPVPATAATWGSLKAIYRN